MCETLKKMFAESGFSKEKLQVIFEGKLYEKYMKGNVEFSYTDFIGL